ncbi:MAG: alpha-1,4-glucan--maltose-1-phosphate maltosyltransferase [Candidatus Omnitrophica bacterium]|nr:alpha-1,4-glucan--maltose-1-phosphate maltosyltransferase [Candidatus Omnitrophota bacterium]
MPIKANSIISKKSGAKKKAHCCSRVMIEKVSPEIDAGLFPIKRTVGENVVVRANIFTDGQDEITALLLYRTVKEAGWHEVYMKPLGNDLWIGSFPIEKEGDYYYSIRCSIDKFSTWRKSLDKKMIAKQDISVDLKVGILILEEAKKRIKKESIGRIADFLKQLRASEDINILSAILINDELLTIMRKNLNIEDSVTYHKELKVSVERKLALFSSWYEFFPRSWGAQPGKHGTFKECEKLIPEIARMGFDIIYLPPIHPIGKTNRKGVNNSVECKDNDPGCPWAIGSQEGGHKAVHPQLGTVKSFRHFIDKAKEFDLEVALDLAYQCSADHPYVKVHPQWFKWRPDGKIQYAENPPKKYEDILPINFETDDAGNLWEELKSIVIFWIGQGVRIFRADNPHTKPFAFWDWLISEIKKDYPDTIFLSEAFTRPNVMYRLAKGGFSQSYTYFTWRNTKREFIEYLRELTQTEVAEYFRPNFWPNTPDILPEQLQYGGRPAFIMRAVLGATLSSNFGIYGPAFELGVSDAIANKEEYLNSEKYEIKQWDWNKEGHLKDVLAALNKIRKENPALQLTRNIRFCEINNDSILSYYKATGDYSNIILVIVNLDPYHTQSGFLQLPLDELGIDKGRPYLAHDLLSEDKYIWQGETSYIELDPQRSPAHIIHIKRHMRREQDFDYFV